MLKSVRKGATYMVAHRIPLWPGPEVGTIVKVVNLPGGFRGGVIRNVEDEQGNIYCVHISTLQRI